MGIIIPAILGGFLAKTMIDIATYYQYRYPMGDYEMRRLYKIEEVPKWQSTIAEAIAVFGTEMASETLSIYMGGRLAEHLLKKYADDLLEKVYYKLSPKLWNIERRLNRRTKNIDRFLCNFSNDFKNRKRNDILEKAVEQAMKDLKYAKMYKRYANESTKAYKQSELRSAGLFGLQIFEWGIEWLIWMENLGQTVRKQIEFGMENLLRIINNIPWDIDMTRDELRRLAESGMGGKELAEKITREDRRTNEILLRLKQLIEFRNALRDFRLKRDEFRKNYKDILEKKLDEYNKKNTANIRLRTQEDLKKYTNALVNTVNQIFTETYSYYKMVGSGNGVVYRTTNKNDERLNLPKSGRCGYGYAPYSSLYFGSCNNKQGTGGRYSTFLVEGYTKVGYRYTKGENFSVIAESKYSTEQGISDGNINQSYGKILEMNRFEAQENISKEEAFYLINIVKSQRIITKEEVEARLNKQASKIKNKYNFIITRLQNRMNEKINFLNRLKQNIKNNDEIEKINEEINKIVNEYEGKIRLYKYLQDNALWDLQHKTYFYDNVNVSVRSVILFPPQLYTSEFTTEENSKSYRKGEGDWNWYNFIETAPTSDGKTEYIVKSGHYGNEESYTRTIREGIGFWNYNLDEYERRIPVMGAVGGWLGNMNIIEYTFYRKKKRYLRSKVVREISKSIDKDTCIVFKKVLKEKATKTVKLKKGFFIKGFYEEYRYAEGIGDTYKQHIIKIKQSYVYVDTDEIIVGTFDLETRTVEIYRVIFTDTATEYMHTNYEYDETEYEYDEIFEQKTEKAQEKKGNKRRKFICLR